MQTLAAWLRCPNCFHPLEVVVDAWATDAGPGVLGCDTGHRFDVNRRGYATLLPPRTRIVGDSGEMLAARTELLGSGAYAPIRDALIAALRPGGPRAVLDSGAGTGWYLHGILDALGDGARGLAMDLSPAAVARAVRGRPDVDGLVADAHASLPVREGAADALTVVFAPRNPPEFARVVRPGGVLAAVVPRAEHLGELRAAGGLLEVPAGKAEAVADALASWFSPVSGRHVSYRLSLSPARALQLQGMGPSARHGRASLADAELPASVTVSVDVLVFARR